MTWPSYEHIIGFPQKPLNDDHPKRRALDRAHTIRMFEIELYWKRSTYFWILQASVFAGLGLSAKEGFEGGKGILILMLGCVGLLTALAGYLNARGSKFWQQNWERHIDRLEDWSEGRLHKSLWLPGGKVSWSSTRVNDTLTRALTLFWCGVCVFCYNQMFGQSWISSIQLSNINGQRTASCVTLMITLAFAVSMVRQKSRLQFTINSIHYKHLDPDAWLEVRKLPD